MLFTALNCLYIVRSNYAAILRPRYAMLWPVFNFLLILFFIFALLFLVSSIAGADFCYDPDTLMVWYLRK
jgi:hypothetical protein